MGLPNYLGINAGFVSGETQFVLLKYRIVRPFYLLNLVLFTQVAYLFIHTCVI